MGVNNLPKVATQQMRRLGVEPATSQSQVQCLNHYTTEPMEVCYCVTFSRVVKQFFCRWLL